jgi:hypothetical protein
LNTDNIAGFISFDIEIVDDLPEGDVDLRKITPSVGAFCTTVDDVKFFYDKPFMTKETAKTLVNQMMNLYKEGYIPFGWNFLSFDFQLLAHYTQMYEECAKLVLNGIDGMFNVVARKGYFLSLDKVLKGANIESKVHSVTLKDGTNFSDEKIGAKAPLLWRSGEYEAVQEYLHGDVVQPLKFIKHWETKKEIRWTSNSGKPMLIKTEPLTVKECLQLPIPDTSWMSDVKPRTEFYSWIPLEILHKELNNG